MSDIERTFSFGGSGSADTTGAEHSPVPGATAPNGDGNIGGLGATSFGDSGGNGGEQFDPAIHVDPGKRNADGSFRRKRGRKPNSANSGNKTRPGNQAGLIASIEALSSTLVIVHAGIASGLRVPELAIDENEGKSLAVAVANVMEQFDITPDPKAQAIVGLIIAAGSIYGPRVYLYRERKKAERKAKQPPTVVPFPGQDQYNFTPPPENFS